MAKVETINAAQKEVAQRFVEAYAKAEGEEYASDLIVRGAKNHRFYITMPGDEGHSEYNYSGMRELITEYETRGSAVGQIAALAGGNAAPSVLSGDSKGDEVLAAIPTGPVAPKYQEYLDAAVAAAGDEEVTDGGEDGEGDDGGVVGGAVVGDSAEPIGDGSPESAEEVQGEGDDGVLFTGGGELPDLDGDSVALALKEYTEGKRKELSNFATALNSKAGRDAAKSLGVSNASIESLLAAAQDLSDGMAGGGSDDGVTEGEAGEGGEGEGAEDADALGGGDGDGGGGEEQDGDGATDSGAEDGGADTSDAEVPDTGTEGDDGEDDGQADTDESEGEQLKEQALEKVRSQNKGKKSKKSHAISSLIAAMLKHSDAGAQGKLALAEDLYDLDRIAKEEGLNRNEQLEIAQNFFESKGRKFPDKSSRSKLKTVWETWFADTGYDLSQELTSERLVDAHGVPKTTKPDSDELLPMPLASQDYNTLYVARNLVEGGEDEHNATLLAMINTFSYKTIAKVAQHLDFDTMTVQFDEWLKIKDPVQRENTALSWAESKKGVVASDYKSISVLASTYEQFMGMIPRMTELAIEAGIHQPVEGKESSVSKAFVLDMLIATWEEFTDADKVLFIKLHHGTISAEEYTQLTGREMDIEVEGVPAD